MRPHGQRRAVLRPLTILLTLLFACVEGPTGPGNQLPARLRVDVLLPAGTPAAWLPNGDSLRVLVRRAGRVEPILDTALVADPLTAQLVVPLEQAVERFVATAELAYGGRLLFIAFDAVQLRAGLDTAITLAAVYVGPGGGAAVLTAAAADSTLSRGDTTRVVPTALDSLGQTLGRVPARFLSLRPDLFVVDTAGLVTALDGLPDSTLVDVVMPTGLTASLPLWLIGAFTPLSGQSVAFISTRDGNRELYVMQADGTEPVRLTDSPEDEFFPAWKPDGSAIAFEREVGGSRQVFLMALADRAVAQLTTEGANSGPRFSPDGARLAFTSARAGRPELWAMDADGGNQRRIADPFADGSALAFGDWSPDGRALVFLRRLNGEAAWTEAWISDTAGGSVRQVLGPGEGALPNLLGVRWGPLGGLTAYTHAQSDTVALVLGLDQSGGSAVDAAGATFVGNVVFAGADDRFVFESDAGGPHAIYGQDPAGPAVRLSPPNVAEHEPDVARPSPAIYVDRIVISPDSVGLTSDESAQAFTASGVDAAGQPVAVPVQWLPPSEGISALLPGPPAETVALGVGKTYAIASYRGWRTDSAPITITPATGPTAQRLTFRIGDQIYTMRGDGADTIRLTTPATGGYEPAFSPDGARVAWANRAGGSGDLWVMNADGSAPTAVTSGSADDTQPSWSPDGRQVVFSANRVGTAASQRQLWVVRLDGTGLRQLTFPPAANLQDVDPAWSPDGSLILFTRYVLGSGTSSVRVVTVADGTERALAMPPGSYRFPAWVPDGSAFVYTRVRVGTFIEYLGVGRMAYPPGTESVLSSGSSPRGFAAGGHLVPSVAGDGLIAFASGLGVTVMRGDGTALSGLVPGGVPGNWQPATPPRYAAAVSIGGDVATPIAPPGTRQLTASATDQNGAPIVPAGGFRWQTLDTGVATVDSTGLVRAAAAGSARIVASAGLATPDTATVTVAGPVVPLTRTWVGGSAAGPADWFAAGNWSPAGVPLAADSVIVVSSANPPVLTASATVARLRITGGNLTLNGQALTVTGDVSTEGGAGTITMQQPGDRLVVGGNAVFQGGSTFGLLTDGVLSVAGDFEQRQFVDVEPFQASGSHRTVLDGSSAQLLVIQSRATFGHLQIANTGGGVAAPSQGTGIEVEGTFTITTPTTFQSGDPLDVGGDVSTVAGSTLSSLELRLSSGLGVAGTFDVALTEFAGQAQEIPDLPYRDVHVSDRAVLSAAVTLSGSLLISGGSGGSTLAVNGHTLTAAALTIGGGGADPATLTMQNPSDVVLVTGDAVFDGDSAPDRLTEGVLYVGGDLIVGSSASNLRTFRASANHRTVLNGSGAQALWILNPATFHHLEIANAGPGVSIPLVGEGVDFTVGGKLVVSTPVPVTGTDANVDVGDSVVTVAGSSLTLARLQFGGGIAVAGALDVETAEFDGSDQTVPVQGTYQNVVVSGQARLAGPTSFPGFVLVRGAGADLSLNGHRLVTGTLTTGGIGFPTGTITMTSAADTVEVQGDVAFAGGGTAGLLTAGTLIVRGGFYQAENAAAFQPSGSHRTVLAGTTQQIVSFDSPGTAGASSHFQDLELAQTAGAVRFQTAAAVVGELRATGARPQLVTGPGALLSVAGADVAGLTLDGIAMAVGAGAITRFDDVTFQNQDPTAVQLGVAHPGAAAPFTFDGVQFLTLPTTGYYVSAADVAPGDGNVLTINMTDAVPPNGSTFTQTSGGAVVTWAGGPGSPAFAAMDQGLSFGCGLTTAGRAYCWGTNAEGQLGDGTTTQRTVPTAVAGGLTFTAISAGGQHSCGLDSAGLAYCWGSNVYGQLGDGSNTDRLTPVAVVGGFSYSMISAGEQYTCGVQTSTGLLYCWGRNTNGQLGDGTSGDRNTLGPVEGVEGLAFGSVSAAIGQHTCAVTTTGAAYCWGRNTNGQLGDGSTTDRLTPVAVSGGLTFSVVSASANEHTCGVTTGGPAYCWGWNNFGALGDGTTTTRLAPVAVSGGLTFAVVSGGANGFTCGLTPAGAGYCWGLNNVGQLGDGTTTTRLTPVAVSGGLTFLQLSAGFAHVSAVATGGTGYAWGGNNQGQLGDGTTTNRNVPTPLVPPVP